MTDTLTERLAALEAGLEAENARLDVIATDLQKRHDQAVMRVARLEAENAALARKVYVPGLWRCPKCNFELLQSNLNAADGTVTARDTPGDKCPNCDGPLWRVTERERHHSLMRDCVRWWEEKQEAVGRLSAVEAENARLRQLLRRWCRAPEITEIGAEDRDPETEKTWSATIKALGDKA